MYILIDATRMAVIYRCEKVQSCRALAHIEFSHHTTKILSEDQLSAYEFSVSALQKLFEGLTNGVNPHSHNREYLVNQIVRLCQSAEPSKVDAFEVTVQSLQIKDKDRRFYRYVPGVSYAEELEEPPLHPPLLGNWKVAQGLPMPTGQTSQPAPVQAPAIAQPWAVQPTSMPPKYAPPWA